MKKIDPQQYDYMWSNFEINFIFATGYLSPVFSQADIVLIYDWVNQELKFFIGKEDRNRISHLAYEMYKNNFKSWCEKILSDVKKSLSLLEETKKDQQNITQLSLSALKSRFLERIKLGQALLDSYFFTEFFALDEAEKDSSLKETLAEMGQIKLKTRETLNLFGDYRILFRPYVEEMKSRFKRNDLEWLSLDETIDILEGKNVVVPNRSKDYWILAHKFDWKPKYGKEAEEIMRQFDSTVLKSDTDELTGVIANKGIYKGKARVLRTLWGEGVQKEIDKVKKGDVLIANTTGPEIMVACERAGAIVTDEGGLTSHAAIISRELKIPCIVGTKIGTKVFKDGDIVEVDANRGIVKLLK